MAVNKVVYGNDTLMDITDTTATAEDVASGKVFYTKNGTRSTGTALGATPFYDFNIYRVLSEYYEYEYSFGDLTVAEQELLDTLITNYRAQRGIINFTYIDNNGYGQTDIITEVTDDENYSTFMLEATFPDPQYLKLIKVSIAKISGDYSYGIVSLETDPIYSASAAATISSNDITNWNSKLDADDYATTTTGGVIISANGLGVNTSGTAVAQTKTYAQYTSATDGLFIAKGTLENVITGKGLVDTTDLATKQDTLVSGTNIKTINNQSLLGSGNISISGGSGSATDVQINGTSITSNGTANILTNTAYNSSSNKIATMTDVGTKQDTLVSGTNIKTINNESLLGSGNITISGGSGGVEYINASFLKTAAQGNTAITSEQRTLIESDNLFYYTDGVRVYRSIGTISEDMETYILFECPLYKKYRFYINRNNYVTMTEYGTGVNDIKINNTSIVSSGSANIVTNTAYNSSSNKIATMSDIPTVPTKTSDLTNDNNFIDTSGATMAGALVAQNNTNYTTKQVRNVVFSTSDPTSSDGANGDIWIKYS